MKKLYSKINKKIKIILNSSFRLAGFFVILLLLFGFFKLYRLNKTEESTGNNRVYFALQQESSPFSVPLEKYSELYSRLSDNSRYDYYECYLQYLEGLPASQSFFHYETQALSENCEAALCIQISENLQKDSDFKCYAGRLLNSGDFSFNGGTIPIIAGYEYRNLLPLGTQFSATYLYNVYTFEVVGILEENSKIYNPAKIVYLDKYVIMPSFHALKLPENMKGLSIHYANRTSGILVSPKEDFAYASGYIKQLLSNAECGEYSVNISPVKYALLEETGIRLEWVIIFLSAAALIAGILYIKYIRKEKGYIAQNLLLFTCAEFVSSSMLFMIMYRLILYLFIIKIDIKIFLICEIFVFVVRDLVIIFHKKLLKS